MWFMEKHTDIKIQEIFRIRAVFVNKNETFGDFYTVPHTDDEHDHKTMIYYVNDSDGDTVTVPRDSLGGQFPQCGGRIHHYSSVWDRFRT
jgi:hypothetical protein